MYIDMCFVWVTIIIVRSDSGYGTESVVGKCVYMYMLGGCVA